MTDKETLEGAIALLQDEKNRPAVLLVASEAMMHQFYFFENKDHGNITGNLICSLAYKVVKCLNKEDPSDFMDSFLAIMKVVSSLEVKRRKKAESNNGHKPIAPQDGV